MLLEVIISFKVRKREEKAKAIKILNGLMIRQTRELKHLSQINEWSIFSLFSI